MIRSQAKLIKNKYPHISFRSIGWFTLSVIVSNLNDVLGKFLGQNLPTIEVTFLRYLLGIVVLIPVIAYFGKKCLFTTRPWMHVIRGALLVGAMAFWFSGLKHVPITLGTIISFAIPLFTLPMAYFFLKEHVGWQRWLGTLVGFAGVLIVIEPSKLSVNPMVLFMLLSAVIFATLDIINKRFVIEETHISMLLYPGIIAALIAAIPAIRVWQSPSLFQWALLLGLGCGSNLILYCILRAFALSDASFLAPFRYTELIFSACFGYFLFREVPTLATVLGGMVIVGSTFYIAYNEAHAETEAALDKELELQLEELPEFAEKEALVVEKV